MSAVLHPRREEFDSDVEFWAACMDHLSALHPEGVELRRSLWRSIEAQADLTTVIRRMRELLALDRAFTEAEEDEYDALAAAYRAARRARREAAAS